MPIANKYDARRALARLRSKVEKYDGETNAVPEFTAPNSTFIAKIFDIPGVWSMFFLETAASIAGLDTSSATSHVDFKDNDTLLIRSGTSGTPEHGVIAVADASAGDLSNITFWGLINSD